MQTNISAGLEKGATRKSFYNKHKQASRTRSAGLGKSAGKKHRVLGPKVPTSLGVHKEGQDRESLLLHTAQRSTGGQEGRGSEFPHPHDRVVLAEIGRPCVTGQRGQLGHAIHQAGRQAGRLSTQDLRAGHGLEPLGLAAIYLEAGLTAVVTQGNCT